MRSTFQEVDREKIVIAAGEGHPRSTMLIAQLSQAEFHETLIYPRSDGVAFLESFGTKEDSDAQDWGFIG